MNEEKFDKEIVLNVYKQELAAKQEEIMLWRVRYFQLQAQVNELIAKIEEQNKEQTKGKE
jgi:hypothetical protein